MTHGCLLISGGRRTITLHTYHTGMDIPEAVQGAIKLSVDRQTSRDWVLERAKQGRKELLDYFRSDLTFDWAFYPTSVAAAVIAAKPFFLEPVTAGVRKDLPTWSGIDTPYRLTLRAPYWHLTDEKGANILSVNLIEHTTNQLLDFAKTWNPTDV